MVYLLHNFYFILHSHHIVWSHSFLGENLYCDAFLGLSVLTLTYSCKAPLSNDRFNFVIYLDLFVLLLVL